MRPTARSWRPPCSAAWGSRARTSRPRWWRATATPSCSEPSPRRVPAWSAWPPRSATFSAPRCARSRSRSGQGQKGSSAMPHKRNPIVSERITGIARLLRGYAQAGLENVALWHERDISHSSVERVALPDATILLDYAQHLATRVVERDDRARRPDAGQPRCHARGAVLSARAAGPGGVRPLARRRLPDRPGERAARLATRGPTSASCWRRRARAGRRRGVRPRGVRRATRPRSSPGWTASRAEVQAAGRPVAHRPVVGHGPARPRRLPSGDGAPARIPRRARLQLLAARHPPGRAGPRCHVRGPRAGGGRGDARRGPARAPRQPRPRRDQLASLALVALGVVVGLPAASPPWRCARSPPPTAR